MPDGSEASATITILAAERLGDVAHEAAQELVADRARGALGDRAEQLVTAEPTGGEVVDTSSIVPPPSGHAGQAALMRCPTAGRCSTYATLSPSADHAPDPLTTRQHRAARGARGAPGRHRRRLPRRPHRVRQRARRGAVRLHRDELRRPADRDAVAGARARALPPQPRALLRARAPAALHRARLRPAQGRHRVHRRDELGHRRQRRGPAAARDRPQHLRAARDRGATAPPVRAAGGGRRARRARAARGRAGRAGQEAAERVREVLGVERVEVLDGPREIAAWGALERAASRVSVPIHTGDRVHGALVATVGATRARSARRRARSCRRWPTCWRSASRACTSRSRCASRRSTTR